MADEQQPGSGELSQDDIDALFNSHAAAGAAGDAGDAGGASVTVAPEVEGLLGAAGMRVLGGLATQAADVLTVGIDSVAGQRAVLVDAMVSVTDYAAVEREYASVEHMGLEIRVALSPSESHLVVALVPLAELGALLSLDLSPGPLADADFATAQREAVATAVRELLDLVSLTLFTEGLQGVEATLSDLRIGQIDYTMGILGDVAQGAPALRLQLALARTDGSVVMIVLVVPAPLLDALAKRLDSGAAEEAVQDAARTEPTPLRPRNAAGGAPGRPGGQPRGFGPADESGRVSPLRPAGTFGASAADDVDVHPVRFPPLPDPQGQPASPRSLDLIMDVSMRVTVELGRSTMTVEDVLALGPGSVIELNKLAGEPVDILVNDQLIARGEVVVVDENFGVRVTEIVSPRRRARVMGD